MATVCNVHIRTYVTEQVKWSMIINTYCGDCMCFSELVDFCIEDGNDKDERPVCKVYKKPGWAPDWTRELYSSWTQRGKEVSQVEPECQGWRSTPFLGST